MSRHSASVVAVLFDEIAEPVERSSRSAANEVSGAGTNRRPAAAATSRRNARRKPSDSSEPCQWVPQVRPTRQPSKKGFTACHFGDPVVDLVALDRLPEGLADGPGQGLLPGEPHGRAAPQSSTCPRGSTSSSMCSPRLEAAADAEDRPPLSSPADQSPRETALPQPLQGTDGPRVPGPPPGPRRPAPAGPRTARRRPVRRRGRRRR